MSPRRVLAGSILPQVRNLSALRHLDFTYNELDGESRRFKVQFYVSDCKISSMNPADAVGEWVFWKPVEIQPNLPCKVVISKFGISYQVFRPSGPIPLELLGKLSTLESPWLKKKN